MILFCPLRHQTPHTSKRIFARRRDAYGFTGKITIVKDYICGVRQRRREMFVNPGDKIPTESVG